MRAKLSESDYEAFAVTSIGKLSLCPLPSKMAGCVVALTQQEQQKMFLHGFSMVEILAGHFPASPLGILLRRLGLHDERGPGACRGRMCAGVPATGQSSCWSFS